MVLSLKISNVIGNELELIQRLKKVNSPGKKALMIALKNSNYSAIYKELLFRIELYAENKVLNYTKQDINTIVTSLRKVGIDIITNELVKKYVPVAQQQFIAPTAEIIQPEVFKQQVIENITETSEVLNTEDYEDISGCSPKKAFDILDDKHSVAFENITLIYNNQKLQIGRYFNKRKRSFGTQFRLNGNSLIKTEKFKNFKDFSKKCIDEIIKAVIQNKIDTEKVVKESAFDLMQQSIVTEKYDFYNSDASSEDFDEMTEHISLSEFEQIIDSIDAQISDGGYPILELFNIQDDNTFWNELNPTDTILEVIGFDKADETLDDGTSIVERILENVEAYFQAIIEEGKDLSESENFSNINESFDNLFNLFESNNFYNLNEDAKSDRYELGDTIVDQFTQDFSEISKLLIKKDLNLLTEKFNAIIDEKSEKIGFTPDPKFRAFCMQILGWRIYMDKKTLKVIALDIAKSGISKSEVPTKLKEYPFFNICKIDLSKDSIAFVKRNIKTDKKLNESAGDYKKYFLNKLQDFGVESPADLSTEEKTKFFNEISDEWESQSLNESEDKEKTPKDYHSKKLSISSKTFENNCKDAKYIAENMGLFDKETSDNLFNKVIIRIKKEYNADEEVTNKIIEYIQDLYYKASNLNESESFLNLDESFDNLFEVKH